VVRAAFGVPSVEMVHTGIAKDGHSAPGPSARRKQIPPVSLRSRVGMTETEGYLISPAQLPANLYLKHTSIPE